LVKLVAYLVSSFLAIVAFIASSIYLAFLALAFITQAYLVEAFQLVMAFNSFD
jgi:hypothetical protein